METKSAHGYEKQCCHMADSCQMQNSSVAQERGMGGGGGENRHSKVRTTFFFPPGRYFFLRQQEESILFFWSLSPQALQNVDALLSSWKIRAMITLKKFYLSEFLPSM